MDPDIKNDYESALKFTGDSQAAAIMVLAQQMNLIAGRIHDLDHQICMGIRMGLFHSGSLPDIDVNITKEEI